VAFLIVASFPHLVPGGYKALLIGPALEGTFGGLSTLSAAIHAYVSDTTPDGSRAAAFGRIGGASVTGIAFGPMIGSALIKMSGNM
jgi:MFS family permease